MLKIISKHEACGRTFINAYIIQNENYNKSFAGFQEMVNIAKEDLGRDVANADFTCSVITESRSMKNQACITFKVDLKEVAWLKLQATPNGWIERDNIDFYLA